MIVDQMELDELNDAKLARIHPEAYAAKMRAEQELREERRQQGFHPLKDLISFLRSLFPGKSK